MEAGRLDGNDAPDFAGSSARGSFMTLAPGAVGEWLLEVAASPIEGDHGLDLEHESHPRQQPWDAHQLGVPEDLASIWSVFEELCLFCDPRFGQWGLKLLRPNDVLGGSRSDHEMDDLLTTEVVVGSAVGLVDGGCE